MRFMAYVSEPKFYDNLYSLVYKSISYVLLYSWSTASKAGWLG